LDPLLEKIKPIIYVKKEKDSRKLKDVLYEKLENYYILWYHWPFDGHLTKREDYEPVILIIKNENLVEIGIRPHNIYQHSATWLTERGRPVVLFTTAWHGAAIDQGEFLHGIYKKHRAERIEDYTPMEGPPPEWFISADAGQSVQDYAKSLIK